MFFALVLLLTGCGGKKNEPAASGKGTAGVSSSASASVKPGASAAEATTKGTDASGEKSPAPSASATPAASGSAGASAGGAATATPTVAPTPAPTPSPSPTAQPIGTLVDGWIVGIPDYVPRFSYGKIDGKQSTIVQGSNGTDFMLCFQKVTRANVDAYAAELKAKGYTVSTAELVAGSYTLTASRVLKVGEATLIITLTDADGVLQYRLAAPV